MNTYPTILIIDDSMENILLLETILEAEGFKVFTSLSGPEGRPIAVAENPDLIILDIMMPLEHGFDTIKKIKEDDRISEIPIIFISSLDDVSHKVEGIKLGAVDYITKPFQKEEVLVRTRLHIRLFRAHRQLMENQSRKLKELTKAQQSILVKSEDIPEANFSVIYKPIHEAGGDFYDVLPMGNNLYGFFCADVSGHNIGSSLATSALKALIHQNAGPLFPPLETMQIINKILVKLLFDGMYLTVSYAQLNRNRNVLSVVSAGHPPVILCSLGGEPECLESTGDVLGVYDSVKMSLTERKVKKGDWFFLFTDGLIELSENKKKDRSLGIQNLLKAIVKFRNYPLKEAVGQITKTLITPQTIVEDDYLLLGVEI